MAITTGAECGRSKRCDVTVVDQLWSEIEPIVFITRGQFERELENWTIHEVEIDGKSVGAVLTKGPELHFSAFAGAPITRSLMRGYLDPLLAEYGYVLTRTPKTETRQRRFNERFGFHAVGESEFFVNYRMDANTCQP